MTLVTVNEALARAWKYHKAGDLSSAERLYQQAWQVEPHHPQVLHFLGVIALQVGRFADAAARLREAVMAAPARPDHHSNLALAYRGLGQLSEAEAALREALRLQPDQPEILDNLGAVLFQQRRPTDAEAAWRAVLRVKPDHAPAHNNLAGLYLELGRPAEAEAAAREALRLAPGYVAAHFHLGAACLALDKLPEAEAAWLEALHLQPDHAEARHNLGAVLLKTERPDEAVPHLQEAQRLRPGHPETLANLGRALQEVNRPVEAEVALTAALRLRPNHAPTHNSMAHVLVALGRLATAEHHLREALRCDPSLPGPLAQLATLLRGRLPDADRAGLERQLTERGPDDGARSGLLFGIAHVCDARAEYADAARHLREANALALAENVKCDKAYDPTAHFRFVDEMLAACTPELFARTQGLGLDTELPVFIVGLPRSGTTLLEQVLASHPRAHGAGELPIAGEVLGGLAARFKTRDQPWAATARLGEAVIREVAAAYLARLRDLDPAAARVVDKMPDNYLHLGLIAVLFPRAKVIHCRRDPRDVAVSCWFTHFREIRWANDPAHLAARFADYRRAMDHWRRTLPIPVLEVNYEETVADLEGTARRLVAWCGLEWDPACLAFHQTDRPVRTASAAQVRQPLYRHSVARWRHYEQELAPLFAMLPPD